jgi:UDP-2,3-diacylglucosamine pyrophosphatase LpxH
MKKNPERRYRIANDVAKELGLIPNTSGRYRLTEEQENILFSYEETVTETNQYNNKKGFTAISSTGGIMDIKKYCEYYQFDFDNVKSWKLVSHTGIPFYNIAFYSSEEQEESNYQLIKEVLKAELKKVAKDSYKKVNTNDIDNLVISDLHVGAYIDGLIKTKDFSPTILIDYLEQTTLKVNKNNAKEVNIFCLGDLIESFTGLNHKNSWKGLQKGLIGAEVIKFTAKILHEKLLSKINNLNKVYIVAGNHDRLTSDKDEDVDGGAADLIAYALELMGYDIEFNSTVITTEIDNINYILLHGHKGISKKATKDICWDYGKQGYFNVVLEGHLHSAIQKLSIAQRKDFKLVKDDCVDNLRMTCRSYFTGNGYTEDLGYTSNAGFSVIRNNGKGLPDIDNKLL